jgi:hypothetical protein
LAAFHINHVSELPGEDFQFSSAVSGW